MDGRDAMAMPGASGHAPYFFHQRFPPPGPGSQAGMHVQPMGMHPFDVPSQSSPSVTCIMGETTFTHSLQNQGKLSPPFSLPPGSAGDGGQGGAALVETVKKKRGRPRKYRSDGNAAGLSLSPTSSAAIPGSGVESGSASGSKQTQKRGRGRPPGTGTKQKLASYSELSSSAGMGYTPHNITIQPGEDVAGKMMSMSQQGPRATCILAAAGFISRVTLRQPDTSGGTVTYEGRFEIVSLHGMSIFVDESGSRTRSSSLGVILSSPDGRIIGGAVGGQLIAASPIQLIISSFIIGGNKATSKPKPLSKEPGPEHEHDHPLDIQMTQSSTTNENPDSLVTGCPYSRQMDSRNADIDINQTRG